MTQSENAESLYILRPGDVLRLRQSNPYCKAGKYIVLALDTTVCLARTKKRKKKGRQVTNHLVYVLLTDLCHFQQTRKRLIPFDIERMTRSQT